MNLEIRVEKLETELEDVKKIIVELDRKSKQIEEKLLCGKVKKKNAVKKMEKVMEEREEELKKGWNEKIRELQEINSGYGYDKAIVQEHTSGTFWPARRV